MQMTKFYSKQSYFYPKNGKNSPKRAGKKSKSLREGDVNPAATGHCGKTPHPPVSQQDQLSIL